jgi:hypothetical protein
MAEPETLVFAEYAFLIRGEMLTDYLTDDTDWKRRIDNMVKLREAFDTADIDGNNELVQDELDFVLMHMNPKVNITKDDVQRLWDLVNPDGKENIGFAEFVKGMVQVEHDPELKPKFSIEIPNRFELLSLVIDSPINQAEADRLYSKMNPLEKLGVGVLRKVEMASQTASYNTLKERQDNQLAALQKELDASFDSAKELTDGVPEAIQLLVKELKESNARNLVNLQRDQQEALKGKVVEACEGRLHFLTTQQRRDVMKLHYGCVLQAFLIGAVFTILPGLLETFLIYYYETDGMIDAYWTCPYETRTTDGGGRGPDVGTTEWIGGSFEEPYADFQLYTCPYGTCTSIPANPDAWVNASGSQAVGGTWTNSVSELAWECQIENPFPEDCSEMTPEECPDGVTCPEGKLKARKPQESCAVSSWRWCDNEMFGEGDEVTYYCSPLPATPLNSPRLHYWWMVNVTGIVIGIVFELSLLMYTALRSSVLVSEAVGLRLIPLNQDRAFVAEMLVRAAFEMVRITRSKHSHHSIDTTAAIYHIPAAFVSHHIWSKTLGDEIADISSSCLFHRETQRGRYSASRRSLKTSRKVRRRVGGKN